MTKKTEGRGTDTTTGRGTVKGHHPDPDARVPEGGEAPAPTQPDGAIKGAASHADDAGALLGEDTSTATVGKREKQQAEAANAGKRQSEKSLHDKD